MGDVRARAGGCGEVAPTAPSGEAAVVQFLLGVPRTARPSEFSFFLFSFFFRSKNVILLSHTIGHKTSQRSGVRPIGF